MLVTRPANRPLDSGRPGDRAPGTAAAAQWFTPVDPASLPVVAEVVRSLVLAMVLVTVPLAKPHLGDGPHGTAIAVTLAIAAASWIAVQFSRRRPAVWTSALIVMAAAGGALAGLSWLSTAVAVGCVVTAAAGARLPLVPSLAIALETVAALLIAGLAAGAPSQALIGWTACFAGLWAFGVTRRAYVLRADEAEQALAQARRAQQAQARAAALTERARIAREIHDVEYSAAELTVCVSHPLPPEDLARPLTNAGSRYGLTGLRERAELVGGTLTAGPEGGQWQVRLRIPYGTAGREARRW